MNRIPLPQGSIDFEADLAHERRLKIQLLRKARALGPTIAAAAQHIWAHNVLYGFEEALDLINTLPGSYPLHRVDRACARALYYGHATTMEAVRYALVNELDRLPLSPYTDYYGKPHPLPLRRRPFQLSRID
ncbi:hypothetical protein JW848_03060 [Candidatus Bipolaricaulota bacterium]|nr:hypothetical protein [Candidatus Bipolaricaulota bacterium]